MKISQMITTTELRRYSVELSGERLLEILRSAGLKIPARAQVFFQVPGGGDWSNTSVDIDAEHPVHVSWTTETTNTAEG